MNVCSAKMPFLCKLKFHIGSNVLSFLYCGLFIQRNQKSIVQYANVERTLRRIQQSTIPPSPKDIQGIEDAFANENVQRMYGQTMHTDNTDKNQFYRTTYTCAQFGYSVFASQRIIDLIKANYAISQRRYLFDGTFNVVPLLFMQLLIIYFETPTKQVLIIFSLI